MFPNDYQFDKTFSNKYEEPVDNLRSNSQTQ
jgi:hypothetical protein